MTSLDVPSQPLTTTLARRDQPLRDTGDIVSAAVAAAFTVPVRELRASTRRRARVALARQTAMYLAHVAFGLSLSEVGRAFGRDRTTAAHACRRVEDRRADQELDTRLAELEHVLRRRFAAFCGDSA